MAHDVYSNIQIYVTHLTSDNLLVKKFDNAQTSSIYFNSIDKNYCIIPGGKWMYGVTASRSENNWPVTRVGGE